MIGEIPVTGAAMVALATRDVVSVSFRSVLLTGRASAHRYRIYPAPHNFSNSGLVPRQHSSGGKIHLHGISNRGDVSLRTLLIHGARSVLRVAARHTDPTTTWLTHIQRRRNTNIVAVALANKQARVIWALLAHDREYQADYAGTSA